MEGDDVSIDDRHCARISIHALRVEGDYNADRMGLTTDISIHALRVEGDERNFELIGELWIFLSTPSGWRATVNSAKIKTVARDFYPRPPGGGRPVSPACVSL